MLRLTPDAAGFIRRLKVERGVPVSDAPRLYAVRGQVTLAFIECPDPADRVLVADRLLVYIAPDVARDLNVATIDARLEEDETILVIREPLSRAVTSPWLH
jgi:hypothetical protein